MVGVHVDDIVVSGEKDACENFFAKLKEERFLSKTKESVWCTLLCFRLGLEVGYAKKR